MPATSSIRTADLTSMSPGGPRASASDESDRDGAERPIVGVERVAGRASHRTRERTAEHDLAGLQTLVERCELVGQPCDAVAWMVEHRGAEPRLFDDAVLVEQGAGPAPIHRVG